MQTITPTQSQIILQWETHQKSRDDVLQNTNEPETKSEVLQTILLYIILLRLLWDPSPELPRRCLGSSEHSTCVITKNITFIVIGANDHTNSVSNYTPMGNSSEIPRRCVTEHK